MKHLFDSLIFGWGARIRTMIKRTKISCPTIRRHPKGNAYYIFFLCVCNNILRPDIFSIEKNYKKYYFSTCILFVKTYNH